MPTVSTANEKKMDMQHHIPHLMFQLVASWQINSALGVRVIHLTRLC